MSYVKKWADMPEIKIKKDDHGKIHESMSESSMKHKKALDEHEERILRKQLADFYNDN